MSSQMHFLRQDKDLSARSLLTAVGNMSREMVKRHREREVASVERTIKAATAIGD